MNRDNQLAPIWIFSITYHHNHHLWRIRLLLIIWVVFHAFYPRLFLSFKSLLWRFPFSKMQRCRIRSNDQGCLVFQNVHKEKLCYSLDIVAIVKMEKNMLFSWHYYGNRQNGKIVLFSRHCGNRQSTRVPSGRCNNSGCRGGIKECQPQWTSSITVVWEGRI